MYLYTVKHIVYKILKILDVKIRDENKSYFLM